MKAIFKEVFKGNIDSLTKVLDSVEDINVKDESGRTPLIQAIIDNKVEIASLLINRGADVNIQDSKGYTALHYASQNYSLECCKLLLGNNASVDIVDEHGNTPLFRATFNSRGRGEVIELLIQYGANKDMKNKYGVSPFELANTIANFDVKQFFK